MLPCFDRAILGPRRDTGSIGRPIQRVDFIRMPRQGLLRPLAPRHGPQLGRGVLGRGDEIGRIRTPGDLVHASYMPGECHYELSVSGPDLDLFVESGNGEMPTVGTELQIDNEILVPRQSLQGMLTGDGVPYENGVVVAAADEDFGRTGIILELLVPVLRELVLLVVDCWCDILRRLDGIEIRPALGNVLVEGAGAAEIVAAQRQSIHTMPVALQRPQQFPTMAVVLGPHLDRPIPRRRVNQVLRTPFYALDAIRVSTQRDDALSRPHVPHLGRPVLRSRHQPIALLVGVHRFPRNARDKLLVRLDRQTALLARGRIPQNEHALFVRTRKPRRVRGPARRQYVISMLSIHFKSE